MTNQTPNLLILLLRLAKGWYGELTQALYLGLRLRSESRRKDKEERRALRKGELEYKYMKDPPNGA
jgi:hypothetical protein